MGQYLEPNAFEKNDAKEIATSLKRSADKSGRRKAEPFRLAMRPSHSGQISPGSARLCIGRDNDDFARVTAANRGRKVLLQAFTRNGFHL